MQALVHKEFSVKFQQEWKVLLDICARYTIQQEPAWINAYIANYLKGRDYFFLTIRDDRRELVAALGVQTTVKRFYKLSTYRRHDDLGIGVNDFFNILCRPGYERECADKMARWFRDNSSSWERLHFSFVPERNVFERQLVRALSSHFNVEVTKERSYYKIDTSTTWEHYFVAERNQKLRDLRGRLNRVARSGYKLTVKPVTRDIATYLPAFLKHFTNRRTEKGEKNSFENPQKVGLIQDVIEAYEEQGKVQLTLLEDQNGEIWAYQLDLIDRAKGIWYHYAPTLNARFKEFSPSKILLFESLKLAFADAEINEFNFMRGEAEYKKQFTDASDTYLAIDILNRHSNKIKLQNFIANVVAMKSSKH